MTLIFIDLQFAYQQRIPSRTIERSRRERKVIRVESFIGAKDVRGRERDEERFYFKIPRSKHSKTSKTNERARGIPFNETLCRFNAPLCGNLCYYCFLSVFAFHVLLFRCSFEEKNYCSRVSVVCAVFAVKDGKGK